MQRLQKTKAFQASDDKESLIANYKYDFPEDDWTLSEKYALELFYMGEAFICQKVKAYSSFFGNQFTYTYRDIADKPEKYQFNVFRAVIHDMRMFPVKKEGSAMLGRMMAKVTLIDKDMDRFSATIFPDQLDKILSNKKVVFEKDIGIKFSGSVNHYNDEFGVIVNEVYELVPKPSLPEDKKSKKMIIERKKELDADISLAIVPKRSELTNELLDFISELEDDDEV
jgi:hypothetical protein